MCNRRLMRGVLPWMAALTLSGCVGGHTPTARFYLLEPLAEIKASPAEAKKTRLVLAPIRIPGYLDRSQIVTASGDNSYSLSEYERWAEGLEHNIFRVLQQDLSRLVPADVILSPTADAPVLKLAVTILQFHADAQGQAKLEVQWQISRDGQPSSVQQRSYRESSAVGDYRKIVAGLNACLNRMARDIADQLHGYQ